MFKKPERKETFSRVDLQVSLLAACMVVLSSICIFIIAYRYTYADMLLGLTDRVDSIYSYLELELDPETFVGVNSKQDMDKSCYRDMKTLFHSIKQATGVQYLYTAKRAQDGSLVYVIDGLDASAADFRYPGDPIEEEIVPVLNRALAGEAVMPDDIKHTPWGDIFIAYLPIHSADSSVIGVIGIEFAAGHQYETFQKLRQLIPLVIACTCFLAGVLALIFFRRISNPQYQDLANTDSLTGLKNRNAYEMDTHNRVGKGTAKGTGMLLADLNGLKRMNDTLGHEAGDAYIRAMADALRDAKVGNEVLYRIGGDEFVVLLPNATPGEMVEFAARLEFTFAKRKETLMPHASYAIGSTVCADNGACAFDHAYRDADKAMYEHKKEYYETACG